MIILGWSIYIGKAISAKNFYSLDFYLRTTDALIVLAALNNPPYFILTLQTDPYAPLPIYLIKI